MHGGRRSAPDELDTSGPTCTRLSILPDVWKTCCAGSVR